MMKKTVLFIILLIINIAAPLVAQQVVNPLDFGLRQARDGKERYAILHATHQYAYDHRLPITYAGIDTIDLDVPDGAKSMPLPYHTDFAGVVLKVRNDSDKDVTLFLLGGDSAATPITVTAAQIDNGNFSSLPQLAKGDHLLIINDKNPWTERIGYGYKCYRADLLYIHDGKSLNQPVTTYSHPATQLECSYVPVSTEQKTIENVTILRARGEQHKSYCFRITNQSNVLIRNVYIHTPKGKHIADAAIALSNCANCRIEDVTVDSTYSVPGSYGYAISMGNVWNTTFVRLVADAAWGVFGSNNVNETTLRQCDINRFDIHCYGRNARCVECTFRNKQTQFSSMYGTVVFDSCHFIDCIPVRVRSSYNAYTPFDIELRHCTFDITLRYHALVNVMLLATEPNARPELAARCWPNLYIEDLTVNLPFMTRRLILYDPTGTTSECKKPVDYMSRIEINGIRFLRNGKPVKCELKTSSRRFKTVEPFQFHLHNTDLKGGQLIDLIN